MEKGPPLQNKLWEVLVRSRLHPVILSADIEKAFLQTHIRDSERDCLRFHWVEATYDDKIEIYRFARLVSKLSQSPFILEGTLDVHFDNCGHEFREVVEKVRDDIYVDDLVTGGGNINEVEKSKSDSISLFKQGGFKPHKWHSSEIILETNDLCNTTELNFVKQLLETKQLTKQKY